MLLQVLPALPEISWLEAEAPTVRRQASSFNLWFAFCAMCACLVALVVLAGAAVAIIAGWWKP
jgi:hypothetical protein